MFKGFAKVIQSIGMWNFLATVIVTRTFFIKWGDKQIFFRVQAEIYTGTLIEDANWGEIVSVIN